MNNAFQPTPRRRSIGTGPIKATFQELLQAFPPCMGGDLLEKKVDPWKARRAKESWQPAGPGNWTYRDTYVYDLRGFEPLVKRGLRLIERAASGSGKTRSIEFTVTLTGDPRDAIQARVDASEAAAVERQAKAKRDAQAWQAQQIANAAEAQIKAEAEAVALAEFLARCRAAGLDVAQSYISPSRSCLYAQRRDDGSYAVGYVKFSRWQPDRPYASDETLSEVRAAGLPLFE